MTFLEAAFEVLRREGKPLHFKELTKLAIKYDLLSVVGRDPEQMMQTRLQAEVRRPSSELIRTSPGVFGLRSYPPKSEAPAAPARDTREPRESSPRASGKSAGQLELPGGDKASAEGGKKRSRGSRGGKGKTAESAAPATEAASTTATAPAGDTADVSPAEPAAAPIAAPVVAPAAAPAAGETAVATPETKPSGSRSERGRGRRGRGEKPPVAEAKPKEAPVAAAEPADAAPVTETVAEAPADAPPIAESARSPIPAPPAEAPASRAPSASTPPILAPPSAGTPIPVLPSTASPSAQHRPHVPSAGTPRPPRPTPAPAAPGGGHAPLVPVGSGIHPSSVLMPAGAPVGPVPGPAPAPAAAPQPQQPRPEPVPRVMTLADAAYDVLRGSSEGRPLPARQIAEIGVKRRLLRGEANDLGRALRAALVREQRQRDSDGLRPRIRSMGQGQYMLSDRKLEPELYNAERELLDRLNRAREATRVALRRRLRSLQGGSFELLMRLLLERLGMLGAEIVKRGDGVAYYGGTQTRGSRSIKILVAVRPGEAELSREAIGELRAGLKARSYDEGLVLTAGRASAAALTEAAAASNQGPIDVYDQEALTELLFKHQIGIRRMQLPMDYLDTDLWSELVEPS